MRNVERWRPSKYRFGGGELRGSRDPSQLAVGSRLVGDLVAVELGRAVHRYARGRIFDLGCGRVPLFASYRTDAESVICVDWPASLHGAQHVDLFCDVGVRLPFRDAVADTVISSDVLEHLIDPQAAFAEFARLLSPGGVLVLNTPFLYGVHEAPHDYLRHTRFSLEHLVKTSGLEVVEIRPVGGLIDVVADNLAKGMAALPILGRILAAAVQWSALHWGRTEMGHRARSATAAQFPLGHVLVARRPGVARS